MNNTSTELMVLSEIDPLKVFVANGLDPIIAKIEKEVQAEAPDVSTEEGRERIASLAYKVSKSKTALDKMGKDLTDEWRTKTAAVNTERSRAWDKLEALQKKVRQPLTEWEEKEKSRVAAHEANLAAIESNMNIAVTGWQSLSEEDMGKQLEFSKKFVGHDWQEFGQRGQYVVERAITTIAETIAKRKKYDAEQLELEQLRKEKAERDKKAADEKEVKEKKEREERIATEAAEKARKDAEEVAAKEKQKTEREREEQRQRAEKAEREKDEAEARAVRDVEEATRKERERIETEEKKKSDDAKKREADKAHNAKINSEALNELLQLIMGISPVEPNKELRTGKAIIEAIARGKIPHISIKY